MSRGSFQVNLFPYNLRSKCGSERYFLVKSRSIDFGWRRRLLTDEAMANSDLSGLIAILGYVAVAAGIVLYQAFTSGCGWRAWVLHKAEDRQFTHQSDRQGIQASGPPIAIPPRL